MFRHSLDFMKFFYSVEEEGSKGWYEGVFGNQD